MSDITFWWPFYARDYSVQTKTMTLEAKGAYVELLNHYWQQQSPLPDDDSSLSKIVGISTKKWKTIRQLVAPLFVQRDGLWHHSRLDEEMGKAVEMIEKKRKAAEARWGKKSDAGAYAGALQTQCHKHKHKQNTTRIDVDIYRGPLSDAEHRLISQVENKFSKGAK